MNKKITAVCALLCTGAMCVPLAACGQNGGSTAEAYVSMDINPSVEFTLDKHDRVISVYGANEDGQVLLYGEEGIVGEKIEKAVEKVTELAVQYGYLDENNKVVQTSVTGSGAEDVLGKINAKIEVTANSFNLSVSCENVKEAYSLTRRLAAVKEKYPDNAAVQALTPEKLKIVISATETGEISFEGAAALDEKELLALVSQAHEKAEAFATEAYHKAKTAASAVYDKAVGAAVDGIYTTYYVVHHPMNVYDAVAYQGFKTASRGVNAVAEAMIYADKVSEMPFTEAQKKAVVAALGLGENTAPIENSQGQVTLKSVEAYADKLFKNSQASEELEKMKAALSEALDTAESALEEKAEEFYKQYENEIKTVVGSMEGVIGTVDAFLPATVKEQQQTVKNDFAAIGNKVTEALSDGKIAVEEAREIADLLDSKSDEALERIEKTLTSEEKQEVKEIQDKAMETLTSAKTKMESAVAKAETEAKARFEALKAARTPKA